MLHLGVRCSFPRWKSDGCNILTSWTPDLAIFLLICVATHETIYIVILRSGVLLQRYSIKHFPLILSFGMLSLESWLVCLFGGQFDFAINALLSLNMILALLVALVLDNTVPGSKQERGVYIWSAKENREEDPSHLIDDYSLPNRIRRFFRWARCVGEWHENWPVLKDLSCQILVVTNLGYFKAKVIFFIHFGENLKCWSFFCLLWLSVVPSPVV